jgi:hypothetical protein
MKGQGFVASTRLRIGQGEDRVQCAHVWVIGAKRVVGLADDALAQGDGGRGVARALVIPDCKPGERAQGAGVIGAEQALVVSGDLLGQHQLVVAPAYSAMALSVAFAGVGGVGVHRAEILGPGVREPAP